MRGATGSGPPKKAPRIRLDGSRHQCYAARLRGIAGLRHHRRGDEHSDARLAHRDDVRARPERLQETDQVRDIIVEAEATVARAGHRVRCASRWKSSTSSSERKADVKIRIDPLQISIGTAAPGCNPLVEVAAGNKREVPG
jgi:hypothetical protein